MDFEESTHKIVSQEFLAVIIAGFGNELTPLTSNHGEKANPKALLPIANKPMLTHPLMWLEASDIRDVLLICPAPHRSAISHFLHSDSSAFPSLRIDLQAYDETQDLSVGTCTVLKHFSSKIKQDFLILPCDFVPHPSVPLTRLLNKFRTETTYDGSIATAFFFEPRRAEKGSVPDEWGIENTTLPVMWDEKSGTLLYVDTPDEVDKNGELLEVNMSLLSRYPRAKLSAGLQDSHVYICRRAVLDLLQEKPRFESIREELIPWLCTLQYHGGKRAKYQNALSSITNTPSHAIALRHATLHDEVKLHFSQQERYGFTHSAASSQDEDGEVDVEIPTSLRVGVVVHRSSEGYSARANNLHSYLELNRHFLSQSSYTLPTDPESRALIDAKAQISADSMVGHTTKVGERTTIKKSIIGKHCVIGKMARIVGCIIFDHCVIADGVKLDGCILGTNTSVGVKAELSKCVTQAGYEISAGESYRNEKLEVSDWTAPQDSTDNTDEDDDEEDESDTSNED
ncbi:UDP-3-O-glucosamine N-acyltransferase [Cristinia sonorae]|uniref:Translation initiation factor eIF2B subunit gamma n=1 Tax=Cristinia sonorae TaxID=1940300 RepID=A0A8K0UGK9_9AGAR|nr:UDP-3-O-glucosamine N-acyltransferase [Cristinia sonorae]